MKKLIYLLVIICLVLIGFIINEVNDVTQGKTDWEIEIVREHDCDLQQTSCFFSYEGKQREIKILERPVLVNTKHTIQLTIPDTEVEEVWIDFKGVEIDMGYNRLKLKSKGTIFEGKLYLPSCTLEVMTWKAMVILKNGDKMLGHVYKFKTVKNNEN